MRINDRQSKYYGRYRCDICGKMINVKEEGQLVRDTISDEVKDVCGIKCADRYWKRYQLPLDLPSSNTGVNISLTAENGCLFESCLRHPEHCMGGCINEPI